MKNSVPELRALSIAQPWAELILRRRKHIEIRTWKRSYRGPILIHASQTWRAEDGASLAIDKDKINRGAFVGIAELVDIRLFTKADAAMLKRKRGGTGWYESGQYAWVLKRVHRIEPIPSKGKLGLYTVPLEIARKISIVPAKPEKNTGIAERSK